MIRDAGGYSFNLPNNQVTGNNFFGKVNRNKKESLKKSLSTFKK